MLTIINTILIVIVFRYINTIKFIEVELVSNFKSGKRLMNFNVIIAYIYTKCSILNGMLFSYSGCA